jgi:hypothetical protein
MKQVSLLIAKVNQKQKQYFKNIFQKMQILKKFICLEYQFYKQHEKAK